MTNKSFLPIFAFLLAAGAVVAQAQLLHPIPDTEMQQLKGKVKEITVYTVDTNPLYSAEEYKRYTSRGETPPATRNVLSQSYRFNPAGFITEEKWYSDDNPYETTLHSYDSAGRQIREKVYRDGSIATEYTFYYDSNGLPSSAVKTDKSGDTIFTEVSRVTLSTSGDTQIVTHTAKDGSITVSTVEYNPQGKIKSLYEEKTGTPQRMMIFDSQGRLIEMSSYQPEFFTVTIIYTKEGTVQSRFGTGGKLLKTVNNENDTYGNTVRSFDINKNGDRTEISTCTYEYDSHGNWTRKTPSPSSWRDPITVREIVYY